MNTRKLDKSKPRLKKYRYEQKEIEELFASINLLQQRLYIMRAKKVSTYARFTRKSMIINNSLVHLGNIVFLVRPILRSFFTYQLFREIVFMYLFCQI